MNAARELLVDGMPCSEGWPMDRGLSYGDGVFETMRVQAGRIRFEADHSARLAEGCRRLAIPADLARLWIDARAAAARHRDATLRLTVTRGDATARGYAPSGNERPRSLLAVFDPPASDELPARIRAVTLELRLGENPALAGLKHCNRLEQVLGRQALRAGEFEGLMASSSGLLVSGTMSNVFMELDGGLYTPALDRCGVAGVLRAVALREAGRLALPLRVVALPLGSLQRCSALAICNARMGLIQVHELDGRPLEPSPRLSQLAARVAALEEP